MHHCYDGRPSMPPALPLLLSLSCPQQAKPPKLSLHPFIHPFRIQLQPLELC